MADKYFMQKSLGRVPCQLYTNGVCAGNPLQSTSRELKVSVKCTANFSRPRPARPTPTAMSWFYELPEGPLTWDTGKCHSTPLRATGSAIGTLRYCASSWLTSRTRSSLAQSNALITKARAKQSNKFSSIAETVFESRATASMIAKSMRRVGQVALYLRKGHWKSLYNQFGIDAPSSVTRLRPTRRLADGWLELEFGWKPLVQTAYDAIDAYRRRVKTGQFVKASSGSPVTVRDLETLARNVYDGKLAARATHYGYVSNAGVRTLADLGFLSPAQIVWNLLPYSFVIDWFSGTGEALAALSSDFGLTNTGIVQTYQSGSAAYPSRAYTDQCLMLSLNSYRAVKTDTTPIEAYWKPASVTNWRIVTSLALLRQRFHGPL